ncbi:MAG: polysaccharide biosynthesis tyrosine autokinase, partial [Bacteroidales bacterium]|nr:polysaccharide biosynthesis tyrosine autokinase [Bacteroidales bacterium]
HPEIIMTRKHIASLRKSLRESIKGNLHVLKKRQVFLLKTIDENKDLLKSFPMQEQKLEQLTRSFMVNDKIYSFLLDKRAEISLLKASTVSNSRIVEKAIVPAGAIKPKRSLIILVGLILGFILGIAQAFLRNFLNNNIQTIEDVEKLTPISLYGAIPLNNTKQTTQYYDEAIRTLWVNLEFFKTRTSNFAKLIALTSTVSGEGKTYTASNLGKSIAKNSDKRVIILDLDMRIPTLHEKFNIPNGSAGMSTLLTEKYTLREAIQTTDYDNLQIITSGPRSPNPTGLILSVVLESIIEQLSTEYDYILLDTPPIGLVADAKKIIYMSDLTLFLMKADYSKKAFLKEINYLQEDEHINLGIVLNGINLQKEYKYGNNSKYMNSYYSLT